MDPGPAKAYLVNLGIAPSRVSLVLPADSQSFPRAYGATFQWRAVARATAYEWELQVQARDETWTTVTTEIVQGTRHRPKRMMRGRFRWRVRAIREETHGEWSAFYRLYMY